VGGGSNDRVPLAIPLDQIAGVEAVGTDEIGVVLGVFVGVCAAGYVVSCAVTDTSDHFIDFCVY
jgi:hypothetical protein